MNNDALISNKLLLYPKVVCRTPAFALNDEIHDVFETLREQICDASPEFYTIIADLSADNWLSAENKIVYTLWKYFNRAKYRATPYGQFSGISLVPLAAGESGLTLSMKFELHRLQEWHVPNQWLKFSPCLKWLGQTQHCL
jgi:hypothetical protein